MKAEEFIKEKLIITKQDWLRAMEEYAQSRLKERDERIMFLKADIRTKRNYIKSLVNKIKDIQKSHETIAVITTSKTK
jgi:hypothetical protein